MVVLQPIKPGPPRVNLTLKRGRARRALSLLGNNNTQQNLQLAESLLTISAEEFTNKWNFDPIQGVPLPSGRFQWTPLTAVTSSDPTVLPSSDAATTTTKAVTSCNLSSSSSSSTTTSSSSSSSPADNPIPNPAEDKSQEQKTCVTLPPPPPPPLPAPGANVVLCQVSAGQPGDLHKNHKVSESETVPAAAAAKSGDSCESHLCCCTRTCGCSGPKGSSSSSDKATDNMNQGSAKDNNLRVSSSNGIKTEADSGIDSDDSIVDDRESTFVTPSDNSDSSLQAAKLRQTCITEFVRPQKLSTFTAPEPLHHSSSTTTTTSTYSKKRPASSLQEQLNQPPHKKVLLHLRA